MPLTKRAADANVADQIFMEEVLPFLPPYRLFQFMWKNIVPQ
jgi:hypothetical protein